MNKISPILKSPALIALILAVWIYYLTVDWESILYISPVMNILIPASITIIVFLLSWKYFLGGRQTLITIVAFIIIVLILSIILAALNQATDSTLGVWQNIHIQSGLNDLRVLAILYEDDHGGYASSSIPASPCYSLDVYRNSLFEDPTIKKLLSAVEENARRKPICTVTITAPQSFAVSAPLVESEKGKYWCVDSAGFSGKIPAPITKASCE